MVYNLQSKDYFLVDITNPLEYLKEKKAYFIRGYPSQADREIKDCILPYRYDKNMQFGSELYNSFYSYKKEFDCEEIYGFHTVETPSLLTTNSP